MLLVWCTLCTFLPDDFGHVSFWSMQLDSILTSDDKNPMIQDMKY